MKIFEVIKDVACLIGATVATAWECWEDSRPKPSPKPWSCSYHRCPQPKGDQTRWRDLSPGTVIESVRSGNLRTVTVLSSSDLPGCIEIWMDGNFYCYEKPCKPFDTYNYRIKK